MNTPLAQIFRYNKWATLTLLEACRSLTEEQLDYRHPGCTGSVRELLQHVVGGQQSQVLRTSGRQHEGEPGRHSNWREYDDLVELARRSGDELVAIAEALDEDREVVLPFQGKSYRFPLSFFLAHAAEHGVEHRTEIKVALASIGVATPDLDGWAYSAAQGFGAVVD